MTKAEAEAEAGAECVDDEHEEWRGGTRWLIVRDAQGREREGVGGGGQASKYVSCFSSSGPRVMASRTSVHAKPCPSRFMAKQCV